MMSAIGDFKQSTSLYAIKTASSLEEFYEKYSIDVEEGEISVTDRITQLVLTKYMTKKDEKQCSDYCNPSHFYNGVYYFVLSSERYTKAKYVYSYDLDKQSIKYILAPLTNPHFIQNLLVEFGSGFNTPGDQTYTHFNGTGVIRIFDLTRPQGQREIKKHFVEGGCGGWDGSIDEESKEICAFDHVTGETKTFPLFNKV